MTQTTRLIKKSKQDNFREERKRKRERIAIALVAIVFVFLTIAEFRLTKVSDTLPFVNSIFFFGILNLNIILLTALFWLVARNIGKLFLERRSRLLGARLKTKLVLAFLAFSVIPTGILFLISSLYINSSFDKWFSIKIQNTLQASLEITRTYYRNADRNAMHFAEHISNQLGKEAKIVTEGKPSKKTIQDFLSKQRTLLALDAVEYYEDPLQERISSQDENLPDFLPRLSLDLLDKAFSGQKVSVIQHVGSGDLIRCLVPIESRRRGLNKTGVVAVTAYIPVSLVHKVGEIANVFDDYKDTNPLKYPIKTTYFVILVMITLVVVFVAIWIGLFMAKELTDPVERLVFSAQAVGGGNLDVTIENTGHDEISVLIESFNAMTGDLRENRKKLTLASADIERRRLQLEAVLANIGTGVIVVDKSGAITTFNRSAAQLLLINPSTGIDRPFQEVLTGESTPLANLIEQMLKNRNEKPSADTENIQWTFKTKNEVKSLAAIATPLQYKSSHWGLVIVVDDMTALIKGQREMAWREVARRIAHEIKNPLTPIKLSAQRLQRRFGHFTGRDALLLQECTETIVKHTDELKEMVNEFSNFARLPEASPAPYNLNIVIKEVISLFTQAHPKINFSIQLETKMPIFDFDRDQIKRVIINLIDNSIAALNDGKKSAIKKISLETHYNDQLEMAVIEISDNGPGMDDEIKSRVFEPYFSTKKEGTGLGLAIAKRIINDHNGFIRVQSKVGEGTQFLIELPTSSHSEVKKLRENSTDFAKNQSIDPGQ